MEKRKHFLILSGVILLMTFFVIVGCGDDGGSPSDSKGTSGLPPDPGSGNLAGKIVGSVNAQPMAGVTVSVGAKSTVTGSDGTFQLDGVGEGILAVVISGDSVYTRTAAVNTASGRSVGIDAIEVDSNFNLGFYREIARGNHPAEGDLYPTHRWTNSTTPTFIVDTDASVTLDGVIDQSQITAVRSVLSEVVPVFTANFYPSPSVQTQPFTRLSLFEDIPDNTFVFTFDDTLIDLGAYGIALTEPDFTSPTTSTINKAVIFLVDSRAYYQGITLEEIIAHEAGHGFGFRHTSLLPSVMMKVGVFGGLYGDFDQVHMGIMYNRSGGNTDIDNDPIPGAKMAGQPLGVQVYIDRRANFPISASIREQIRALPRNPLLQQYVPGYK